MDVQWLLLMGDGEVQAPIFTLYPPFKSPFQSYRPYIIIGFSLAFTAIDLLNCLVEGLVWVESIHITHFDKALLCH